MEDLSLLYEDIFLFLMITCMILSFLGIFWFLAEFLFSFYIKKVKERKGIYKSILSVLCCTSLFIYLTNSEISDIQYKNIFNAFISNNANIKSKLLDITKDNRITKQEYFSLFFGTDEVLLDNKENSYKYKALKIINNHKL